MSDYTAWVIEMQTRGGSIYFQFARDSDWTVSHDKAAHFADQQSAAAVIDRLGLTQGQPSEHCWPDSNPANPTTQLKVAIAHIEHMAAWIEAQKAGYSFESLGEDMPEMKRAASVCV